jgi:hypothetical protein
LKYIGFGIQPAYNYYPSSMPPSSIILPQLKYISNLSPLSIFVSHLTIYRNISNKLLKEYHKKNWEIMFGVISSGLKRYFFKKILDFIF